jgi:hypothetical protein
VVAAAMPALFLLYLGVIYIYPKQVRQVTHTTRHRFHHTAPRFCYSCAMYIPFFQEIPRNLCFCPFQTFIHAVVCIDEALFNSTQMTLHVRKVPAIHQITNVCIP